MAENNRSLMSEVSIITNSVESIKRSNSEAFEDQLREIKKIRREEPKSFKRKGNEVQYKFNAKIEDSIGEAKSYLESNAVDKAKESLTEVHPLHLGAIASRSIPPGSWIFLQNLGAVLPADNLVIGGLNVRWFVLLLLLNLCGIHDCA